MSQLRIKHLYRVVDDKAGSRDLTLMAVSIHQGVVPRNTITGDLPRAEDLSCYKICEPGDIVVNRMRAFQGAIGISAERGIVSPDYLVLRPNHDTNSRYLHYLFRSSWFVGEMTSRLRGIGNTESGSVRTPRINVDDLGEIQADIPAIAEQFRISSFLDAASSTIDNVIRIRDLQIKALEDLRLSTVSELIPSEPRITFARLGYLAVIKSGITVDSNRKQQSGSITMPYLRVANVQDGYVDLTSMQEITVDRSTARSAALRYGDVLMTEGGDLDKLGRGTVWLGQIENCLHQNHVFAVRTDRKKIDPTYLALITRTAYARSYFESTGTKTTNLASTSSSKIRNFKVPLTDIATQIRISCNIDERLQEIGNAEATLSRQRDLLSERKKALITAAVTGQIDVSTGGASV